MTTPRHFAVLTTTSNNVFSSVFALTPYRIPFLTMENNSDTEMELYEEIVGDVNCPTPNNSRAASPKTLAYSSSRRLAFEGPIVESRRSENADFYSSERSELAPQPALRYQLAGQDARAAVVTDQDGFATGTQRRPRIYAYQCVGMHFNAAALELETISTFLSE